ncbi:MAG: sortase [Bacilli bacterium]|nr:sortase [Bacilli bacterium]
MVRKAINILIFLFIFSLYFISFLMIYDTFRQRKLEGLESNALDAFDKQVKVEKVSKEDIGDSSGGGDISYRNYTILGKIEIPKIGFTSVIIKEYTYNAMNVGVIKSYGVELNEQGGFIISGHNFRGRSLFMYNIHRLVDGDKIYITDAEGRQMEYTVYAVLRNAAPNDDELYKTYDGFHVTLMTCEDDGGKTRIVVKARA